ncbi:hypothetical protein QJS04_geneDACA002030 [Acorus gramineus]|uniref:DUF4378 domain-containing protein n=1 Tax=Acorus gramineus TaxID=55184 RepID=A0AAV9A8G1_ACOGR|nr:hypothetical protein QJS04_geneDACA002030 [Acorus gramineus]
MWGLINMFDFRQGRFTQKMISDRKRESGRVGSQQLHKHGMSNFFRKKEKIQSNKSLKDSDQGVDHIVLLKSSSSNVQNPKSVINLSTSPHCQNSFRSQGESERTSFHFSLREMKRRLKQAIGDDKKERRWISRDGVLHRIPQGGQSLGDQESCEEAPQLMYAHIPVSPSLLIQTVDGSESSDEKVERPSPVSVLDPFSTEEIHSPERSTAQRADFSIQPRRIQFEETDNTSIVVTTLDFETNSRSCIADEESRLDYVRNILETSGLVCGNLSESKWHSEELVLDPSLFDEVETSSGEFSDDLKLLFDRINEALLEIHERYFGPSPWVSFIKPKARSCLKGDDLVQEVMEGIDWYNLFQYPGTLEQIVGKDLTKGETWMDLRLHVEFVGFDMEEAILEDLMEETILELWD